MAINLDLFSDNERKVLAYFKSLREGTFLTSVELSEGLKIHKVSASVILNNLTDAGLLIKTKRESGPNHRFKLDFSELSKLESIA